MSLLLKEIQKIDDEAAKLLQMADLHTDSDIEVLTREELLQLFPAVTDIKLRRAIYNVIHKPVGLERDLNEDEKMEVNCPHEVQAVQMPQSNQKQEVELVLNKIKEFIPCESFRAALTGDGVLVDYLRILKDMKTQMDNVQGFLEAHISLLEEFSKNHPDQESANCGTVTDDCPGEARGSGSADASGKKKQKTGNTGGHAPEPPKSSSVTGGPAEVRSGKSDGRAQGAPGSGTSDIGDPVGFSTGLTGGHRPQGTQKSSSVTGGPAEVRSDKSDKSRGRGAPGSGTSDIGDPVGLSTGLTGGHRPQGTQKSSSGAGGPAEVRSDKSDKSRGRGAPGSGTSDIGDPVGFSTGLTGGHRPQGTQKSSSGAGRPAGGHSGKRAPATLYKMVVSGKTFDTHLNLMEMVKKRLQNQLRPCEGNGDDKITFVFCPISSRIASDVEAAMSNVKDDKPVILVLMHHTREVRPTTSMRTWHDDTRVLLHVNVFYHETVGLLKCDRNDAAVTEIQNKLMERFFQGVDADHGGTDQKGSGSWMPNFWSSKK